MKAARLQALHSLASCLRGEMPPDTDWVTTIALANESMTVTNLAERVLDDRLCGSLPEDVKIFLADVLVRNGNRNTRLLSQLGESVRVLNIAGITPVVLKGAALLVTAAPIANLGRMIADIDILVKSGELTQAIGCLESIGYVVFERSGGPDGPVTLARASDVGMIDLHIKPRGPAALSANDELYATCESVSVHLAQVLVPSPTFQLLHFVLHDQFHNRDYWKGNFDLRHLCDLARILTTSPDIDWKLMHSIFSNRSSADGFACQLIQVNRLLGVPIPKQFSGRLLARFQYWRILAQIRRPYLRVPFICLTVLMGWNHRNRDAVEHDVSFRKRFGGRIRGIWRLFSVKAFGKV